MWLYVVVRICKLVIDLDSELSVAVTLMLYSLTSNRMATSNTFGSSLPRFVMGRPHVTVLRPWLHKGMIFAFYRCD